MDPDGEDAAALLAGNGLALEFLRDQYRHGKTMLAVGAGRALLEKAGIPLDAEDPGLIVCERADRRATQAFVAAMTRHRHPERESDPPRV